MKLDEFLAALKTPNVQVVLVDLSSSAEIITLKAAGYASLDDTIENREVKQWEIIGATSLKVTLGDVLTTEP